MHTRFRCLLVAIGLCAVPVPAYTEMPDAQDIVVAITRHGDTFDIRVELVVDATPEEVFAVLTDYDHMARFVSNVLESQILQRDGNRIAVEQKSQLVFGLFHLEFTNVREVELLPFHKIRSRVTDGDMHGSSFTTTIAARGPTTRVDNRGSFVSTQWIPPLIGNAVLEAETRKQFQEFRIEILRRKGATPGPGK